MNTRFGLLGLTAVVMLVGGFATEANAQVVVITDVQYVPPAGQVKAKADPKGTMSLPADNETYQVVCDYGTISNGVFTPNAAVHAGGTSGSVKAKAGGTHNWFMPNGPHSLTAPPAGLHVRARLQKYNAQTMTFGDVAGAVTYQPCP